MTASAEARRPVPGSPGSGETVLAVETATDTGSVALVSKEGVRAEITLGLALRHGDRILGAIDYALAETSLRIPDLAALAVSAGPGSFTGLRIGLATVKGLAEAHPLPIVAVPTLEALALNAPGGEVPVCPLLDARKGEVYGALYAFPAGADAPHAIIGEGAYAPADLAGKLRDALQDSGGDVLLLGEGARVYRACFSGALGARARFAEGPANAPRAAAVGWLGLRRLAAGLIEDPLTLTPRYLRQSEAELSRTRRPQPR
ncbi:MAG: tRNA (adenosine(37)-N6)-threonylcarbamoyltransferase complex dimerization subunit type 1 TsaB [Myxococcota bacterium]